MTRNTRPGATASAHGSRAEVRRLSSGVPLALEYPNVRHAERGVAQRVTHRVDGAVDVAQVVKKIPHALRHPFFAAAAVHPAGLHARVRGERFQQHQYVVRRPRDDERQQYSRQRFGRLPLALLLLELFLLLLLGLERRPVRPGQLLIGLQDFRRVQRKPHVLRRRPPRQRSGSRH